MCRFLLAGLFLCSVVPGYSQLFSFGLKGGVPLADPLISSQDGSGGTTHQIHRYVVGATGEVHLPFGVSVEVDALYRRLGYDSNTYIFLTGPVYSHTAGNDWQFPVLAKYAFARRPFVSPFADAGVTFRRVNFSNGSIASPNSAGITVGGGITFKLLFVRLSPEIRYTRFPTEVFGRNYNYIRSTSNQADFLVGFTF
ncbi:MAG: outer membrane beta-barrel protein [Acidobacteriota bacterium]|nr:outer membrane beta-barrel protein [Acidobacteriota bacterium]